MTSLCDLHMHSTASDGQYRPAELVRIAKETGLEGILLDIEEYGKKCWQYDNLKSKKSYLETEKIIRLRGRECCGSGNSTHTSTRASTAAVLRVIAPTSVMARRARESVVFCLILFSFFFK